MVEYYAAIRRFLRSRLRDNDVADDLAQETFARAFASGGGCNAGQAGTRQAWLFRIAANLIVDFSRRERVRAGIFDFSAGIDDIAQPSVEEVPMRHDVQSLLAAIEALPPKRRDVLILHKIEGYSHVEIAKRLGMKRDSVEKNVVRALADLRDRLTGGAG
jgi:RNA polymerase sigma factor (sigma-70 family)